MFTQPEVEETLIKLRRDGQEFDAVLHHWEQSPFDKKQIRLEVHWDTHSWAGEADSFFKAFRLLRRGMELDGFLPVCYGASRNCYPSAMAAQMGAALVYRLRPGQQPRLGDLVRAFDTGDDVEPVTVEEQDRAYAEWLKTVE